MFSWFLAGGQASLDSPLILHNCGERFGVERSSDYQGAVDFFFGHQPVGVPWFDGAAVEDAEFAEEFLAEGFSVLRERWIFLSRLKKPSTGVPGVWLLQFPRLPLNRGCFGPWPRSISRKSLPKLARWAPAPRSRKLRALSFPAAELLERDCSAQLPVAGSGRSSGLGHCCASPIQG